MRTRTLFVTVLLTAFPIASQSAAPEESTPVRPQEISNPAPVRDVAAIPVEVRAVPDNLQAARKADELPFSEIKILPSF